ncbi:hypothetical protein RhiTH_003587 [Rhizoctonia solani]
MATHSRSTACPASPLDQGELGPTLPATATELSGLEPEVYGEISLGQAISLILGLQNQILRLERELKETVLDVCKDVEGAGACGRVDVHNQGLMGDGKLRMYS